MYQVLICACAALFSTWASSASAGAFTDDMAKCLVSKSTNEDKTALMVWMFSAIADHPAARSMSNVSDSQRAELTKRVAAFVLRLLTVDCRDQTVAALKYEGAPAFGTAFQLLGQVAMQGLMRDPAVAQHFESLKSAFEDARMQSVFKEAGVPMRER
jgi:hypothetical protein